MYKWRTFQFFDRTQVQELPAELQQSDVTCSTSGRGQLAVGTSDGGVHVADRNFRLIASYPAHGTNAKNILVTVGEDEPAAGAAASTCIKLWDFEKVPRDPAQPKTAPSCMRTVTLFSGKFPVSKVTCCSIYEEAFPNLSVALGLRSGAVYVIRGDFVRERVVRSHLTVPAAETDDATEMAVTNLAFRFESGSVHLFATTLSQTVVFAMHNANSTKRVLDEAGAQRHCAVVSEAQELVVGRDEAVYFFEVDDRGPCFVFEGHKVLMAWFRGHLLTVTTANNNRARCTLNIYDLKNKLIAYSGQFGDIRHLLCEWGAIIVITEDKQVFSLMEKDLQTKLNMLYKKNLYPVAINLTQSQQGGDMAATAGDYDGAMAQYLRTIGWLEPSYVIRKFLDAQRIHNLTLYLERLHERGLATADHTTLLLNCYTKLKDVAKLDAFLLAEPDTNSGVYSFDADTAVRVCRAAGYFEHALYVARNAGEHGAHLSILVEDVQRYDDALKYISELPLFEAEKALQKYGKTLVTNLPDATMAVLQKLCKPSTESTSAPNNTGQHVRKGASPMQFVDMFVDQPHALMAFLEQHLEASKGQKVDGALYNTLLELYLSSKQEDPSSSASQKPSGQVEHAQKSLSALDLDRRKKAMQLLKDGWSYNEPPVYDTDHALMLCQMHAFKDGVLYLYERMKLHKEALAVYMQEEDYAGLVDACKRLADDSRGGNPVLWVDVLTYFGSKDRDCAVQVKEVLYHIEKDQLLPPLVVLQTLAKNPQLTLAVVKDYVVRKLHEQNKLIEEDQRMINEYQTETERMRSQVQDLKTKAVLFQRSKCEAPWCGAALDLPAVHFLCMHSYHQRCLGDNERECPKCAAENRTVLEFKRTLEHSVGDHDSFFKHLQNSDDGFSVVADYFGRGILNRSRGIGGSATSRTA
eukprot:jgi/Chlat1/7536/Chrsp62S00554